jgi:hypothetical protein
MLGVVVAAQNLGPIVGRHFDLVEVTSDFVAKMTQHLDLGSDCFDRPEDVPHVGVLGNDTHADLLAHRRNEQRQLPHRWRIEFP